MNKTHMFLIAVGVLLAACSTPKEPIEVPSIDEPLVLEKEPVVAEPAIVESVTNSDCLEPCVYTKDAINDPTSDLAKRIIFFSFNQSTVDAEFQYTIEQHASYLSSHPSVTIRLEGHTDERGSREYNVALGEQRALSIRQMLILQGVYADQITTVSFGEELPLDLGRNESAWSQNRRVEIVYE